MATQFPRLAAAHQAFIAAQPLYFVGSAAPDGRVNVSPKGTDSLRVIDPNRILWRNLTGSGNETAGHLRLAPRMTLMWCSFAEAPLILRVYGTARAVHPGEPDWARLNGHFPEDFSARQVFDLSVDLVQTSCGFGVPMMTALGERPVMKEWAGKKGPEGIRAYWAEKNRTTIDGFPTGIPE